MVKVFICLILMIIFNIGSACESLLIFDKFGRKLLAKLLIGYMVFKYYKFSRYLLMYNSVF